MRIRLKARCHFQGHLYEPGEIIDLPEGMKGPHRAVAKSHDRIDYGTSPPIDANRELGEFVDEPLYEEVTEEEKKP